MYSKGKQKVKSIFKFLFYGCEWVHYQSRIEERGIFIFPAFSIMRTSRKNTLKEIGTAIPMAPAVGFEPTTLRLTAACSTVELRRNLYNYNIHFQKCKQIFLYLLHVEHVFEVHMGQELEEDAACFSSLSFLLYSSLLYSVV